MKKSCKKGYYYCFTSKKCKKIPAGHHVMGSGRLMKDGEHDEKNGGEESTETTKNGNGNGNGGDGGGAVSEGWSDKYKKSINCDNPKGFSQRAHCQGRKKKMNEAKEKQDHEVSMAKTQVKKSIDNLQKVAKVLAKKSDSDNLPAWVQAKLTDTEHHTDAAASYMTGGDDVKEEYIEEKKKGGTLHKWFKGSKSKDGKPGWVNVVTGGTCASDEPGEGTPKCVSSSKRASMTKAERKSAARRKKKADPGQQQKTGAAKPTYVSTDPKKKKKVKEEFEVTEARDVKGKGSGKKDACYHKVKSRYSVWPSAYASGALVKCRKVGAANWGNSTRKEGFEFSNWRDDFKALEIETVDLIKAEPLINEEGGIIDTAKAFLGLAKDKNMRVKPTTPMGQAVTGLQKRRQKTDQAIQDLLRQSYEPEGDMVERVEYKEGDYVDHPSTRKAMERANETPIQKLTRRARQTVDKPKAPRNPLTLPSFTTEAKKCWKGYEKKGTQKLFGKTYNRCVKKEEFSNWREELSEKYAGASDKGMPGWKPYGGRETGPVQDPNYLYDRIEKIRKSIPVKKASAKKTTQVAHFEPEGEIIEGAAWTRKEGQNKKGGLNEKGRKSYERENPGSDLKRPSKKKGNKRRKSFCARMKGMKKKLTSKKTANDPDSRINKSLRAWNC